MRYNIIRGVNLNIKIERDAADFIEANSDEKAITLSIKTVRGG